MPRKMKSGTTISERLEFYSMPEPNSGCHLWIGSQDLKGYGQLKVNGKLGQAHRISWQERNGQISDGLVVLHRCDTPSCINPDHLVIGTVQDNIDDRNQKMRHAHGEGHSRAKLTEAEVIAIRSSGELQENIAARYGVRAKTVSQIKLRQSWRHLP